MERGSVMSGRIERIWIKRMKRGPMDPVSEAELVAGKGLEGNANRAGRRQVTLLEWERWEEIVGGLGARLDPAARRANILLDGVTLAESRGRVLALGETRLRIMGETKPCERMEEALPGLEEALWPDWGGGAFAVVEAGGRIAVGSEARWVEEE